MLLIGANVFSDILIFGSNHFFCMKPLSEADKEKSKKSEDC